MSQAVRVHGTHQKLWHSPRVFATTLLVMFVDRYAQPEKSNFDCLEWDPVTIENELADDFGPIPRPTFDRLMAAINIATSDRFFQSLPDFIPLCNVLSGDTFDPEVFDPADVMECAWGLAESAIIVSKPLPDFHPEIVGYLAEIVKQEGMIAPPTVMRVSVGDDYAAAFNKIAGQFSDDPDMFAAISEVEYLKTDEVNQRVREALKMLFQQLSDLPLVQGATTDVASKVLDRLQQLRTQS